MRRQMSRIIFPERSEPKKPVLWREIQSDCEMDSEIEVQIKYWIILAIMIITMKKKLREPPDRAAEFELAPKLENMTQIESSKLDQVIR